MLTGVEACISLNKRNHKDKGGHCGAIHWSINTDGSVREDTGKNCIYRDSSGHASVRHCSDGFEKFTRVFLGNRFQLKSAKHGDCVTGAVFANCSSAPTFYACQRTTRFTTKCLDRKHCHFSTSNVRIFDCSHCGAIHWSIAYNQVGEDNNKY